MQLFYSRIQIQKMCNLRYVKSNLSSMLARQILTEPHAQMNLLLIIELWWWSWLTNIRKLCQRVSYKQLFRSDNLERKAPTNKGLFTSGGDQHQNKVFDHFNEERNFLCTFLIVFEWMKLRLKLEETRMAQVLGWTAAPSILVFLQSFRLMISINTFLFMKLFLAG